MRFFKLVWLTSSNLDFIKTQQCPLGSTTWWGRSIHACYNFLCWRWCFDSRNKRYLLTKCKWFFHWLSLHYLLHYQLPLEFLYEVLDGNKSPFTTNFIDHQCGPSDLWKKFLWDDLGEFVVVEFVCTHAILTLVLDSIWEELMVSLYVKCIWMLFLFSFACTLFPFYLPISIYVHPLSRGSFSLSFKCHSLFLLGHMFFTLRLGLLCLSLFLLLLCSCFEFL